MTLGNFQPRQRISGDKMQFGQYVGRPLLVRTNEYVPDFSSQAYPNPKPVVFCDVVDLLSGQIFINVLWGGGAVVDNLKETAGTEVVLPVMPGLATAKGGRTYQTLNALEGDAAALAQGWYQRFWGTVDQERAKREQASRPFQNQPAQPQQAANEYQPPAQGFAQPQQAPVQQQFAQPQQAPVQQQFAQPQQGFAQPAAQQFGGPVQGFQGQPNAQGQFAQPAAPAQQYADPNAGQQVQQGFAQPAAQQFAQPQQAPVQQGFAQPAGNLPHDQQFAAPQAQPQQAYNPPPAQPQAQPGMFTDGPPPGDPAAMLAQLNNQLS